MAKSIKSAKSEIIMYNKKYGEKFDLSWVFLPLLIFITLGMGVLVILEIVILSKVF